MKKLVFAFILLLAATLLVGCKKASNLEYVEKAISEIELVESTLVDLELLLEVEVTIGNIKKKVYISWESADEEIIIISYPTSGSGPRPTSVKIGEIKPIGIDQTVELTGTFAMYGTTKKQVYPVTVLAQSATVAEYLVAASNQIQLPTETAEDLLFLPDIEITFFGVTKTIDLTYYSKDHNLVSDTGVIRRHEVDKLAEIVLTLNLEWGTITTNFFFMVMKLEFEDVNDPSDQDYLDRASQLLILPLEVSGDVLLVSEKQIIINGTPKTVQITWVSKSPLYISDTGVITEVDEVTAVYLEATLTLGLLTIVKEIELFIMPANKVGTIYWEKVTIENTLYIVKINDEVVGNTILAKYDLSQHLPLFASGKVIVQVYYDFGDEEVIVYQMNVSISEYLETASFGFETTTKTGYASAQVDIDGFTWDFHETLVGDHANDRTHGRKAARLRGANYKGNIETITLVKGVNVVSFYYASYGAHTVDMLVEIRGAAETEWTEVYVEKNIKTEVLLFYQFIVTDLNPSYVDGFYLKITNTRGGTTNQTLNIDDVTFMEKHDKLTMTEEELEDGYEMWRERFQKDRTVTLAKRVARSYDEVSYYAGIDLNSPSIIADLRKRVTSEFKGTTYGDARFILEQSDLVSNLDEETNMRLMYTGVLKPNAWDGGTWDREHVWPNSRLGAGKHPTNEAITLQTDVHNLRAIDRSINSSRSNKFFDEQISTDYYYPGELDKGDAARILMYMVIMYDSLKLVENSELPVNNSMGKLSLLKTWHAQDTVDEFEKNRNQTIYEYQNNRNPFIDRPELFDKVHEKLVLGRFLSTIDYNFLTTDLRFNRSTKFE